MILGSRPKIFLQPRRNESKIILAALSDFDGFQIGASLPATTADFIKNVGKDFIVDPMAYMFTLKPAQIRDKKDNKIRQSLVGLAERYSSLIASTIQSRAITAQDLIEQEEVLSEIVSNVLEYQRTKLGTGEMNLFNPYYDKYAALIDQGEAISCVPTATIPFTLVAPFFHFQDTNDPMYQMNLGCARLASRLRRPGETVYQTIFCHKGMLSDPLMAAQIRRDYNKTEVDGTFLWINKWDEESAPAPQIRSLVSFVRSLHKPVFKMYGGYLSGLIFHDGLAGFSCNLSCRTSRDIFSYGWLPHKVSQPKFYIPSLHKAFELTEAEVLLKAMPSLHCHCRLCSRLYGSNLERFSDEMAKEGNCERHFLHARHEESFHIGSMSRQDLVGELIQTAEMSATDGHLEMPHLKRWAQSLGDPQIKVLPEEKWMPKEIIGNQNQILQAPTLFTRPG